MQYYNKISEGYGKLYGDEQVKKLDIISKYFSPEPVMLDLGAGTCICAKYFNIETISVDTSANMLSNGIGKRIVSGAESLPFKANSFNSVISLTAFHHFKFSKAINELRRVVKPGSPIAITLLKKASNFQRAKKLLSEFNVKEYDCMNDVAFIGKI